MKAELVPFETVGPWFDENWNRPRRTVVLSQDEHGIEHGIDEDEEVQIDITGNVALVHFGMSKRLAWYVGNIKLSFDEEEWEALKDKIDNNLIPAGRKSAEALQNTEGRHRKAEEPDVDQTD